MNKKMTATLCVLAITAMIGISNIGALSAEEVQPGTSGDPVVTKGYVDKLIKGQDEMIGLLSTELNKLKSDGVGSGGAGDNTYTVVDVAPGEKLIGKQGAEIILRAGEGTVIVANLGGLQDVTGGVDITTGFVPKYHLMIVPRDDGRGVLATKASTFMVRGGYTIE